jgi:hypothetical protein
MTETQTFRELTYTIRPQGPHGDGTGLRFETGEHGGDYPDKMPRRWPRRERPEPGSGCRNRGRPGSHNR